MIRIVEYHVNDGGNVYLERDSKWYGREFTEAEWRAHTELTVDLWEMHCLQGWLINGGMVSVEPGGRRWFRSEKRHADFFIVMVRTRGEGE